MPGPRDTFRVVAEDAEERTHQSRLLQWRIGTLFLLTAVAAIAVAGFSRQGLEGALGAVMLSWLGLIGVYLIISCLLRPPRSAVGGVLGVVLAAFALYGWLALGQLETRSGAAEVGRIAEIFLQFELWRNLLVAGALLLLLWRLTRPKWSVTIIADANGVQRLEGIPRSKRQAVVDFFQQNASLDGKISVHALRQRQGYLRVEVRGACDRGRKQQIRNFLNTIL